MLRTCHCTPGFDATHRETSLTGRSAPPTAALSWSAATALRTTWDVLRDGLAAYRQYERLRSSGIPHETALRAALGISEIGR